MPPTFHSSSVQHKEAVTGQIHPGSLSQKKASPVTSWLLAALASHFFFFVLPKLQNLVMVAPSSQETARLLQLSPT